MNPNREGKHKQNDNHIEPLRNDGSSEFVTRISSASGISSRVSTPLCLISLLTGNLGTETN